MSATLADRSPRRSFSGTAGELGEGILRVATTGKKNDGKLEVYVGHTRLDTLTLRQGVIPLDVSGVSEAALNQIARRVYQLFQEEIASRTATHHALSGFTGRLVTVLSSEQVVRHTRYEGGNEQTMSKVRRHARNEVTPEDQAMTEIYQLVMASQGQAHLENQRGVGYFDPYAVDEGDDVGLDEPFEGVAAATQTRARHLTDGSDSSGRVGSGAGGTRRRNSRGLASRKFRMHNNRLRRNSEATGDARATRRLRNSEATSDSTRTALGSHHGDARDGVRAAASLLNPHDSSSDDSRSSGPRGYRPTVPRLELTGSALNPVGLGGRRVLATRSSGVDADISPRARAAPTDRDRAGDDDSEGRLDTLTRSRDSESAERAIPPTGMVSEGTQYDLEALDATSLQASALHTRLSGVDRSTWTTRDVATEMLGDDVTDGGVMGDGVAGGTATERAVSPASSPRGADGSTVARRARRALNFGLDTSDSTHTSSNESSPRMPTVDEIGGVDHATRQAMVEGLVDGVFGDSIYVSEGPFKLEEIPSAIREGRLEVLCLKGSDLAPYIQHVARDHILCRALKAIRKEEEEP